MVPEWELLEEALAARALDWLGRPRRSAWGMHLMPILTHLHMMKRYVDADVSHLLAVSPSLHTPNDFL